MGDRLAAAIHPLYWTNQFNLRLHDVLHHVVCLPLLEQSYFFPNRMVCGVDFHTDIDHPRHPHEQNSLHQKLGEQVLNNNISGNRGYCGLADRIASGKTFGFVTLPALYWPLLAGMLIAYIALTQMVKVWFIRRFGE